MDCLGDFVCRTKLVLICHSNSVKVQERAFQAVCLQWEADRGWWGSAMKCDGPAGGLTKGRANGDTHGLVISSQLTGESWGSRFKRATQFLQAKYTCPWAYSLKQREVNQWITRITHQNDEGITVCSGVQLKAPAERVELRVRLAGRMGGVGDDEDELGVTGLCKLIHLHTTFLP